MEDKIIFLKPYFDYKIWGGDKIKNIFNYIQEDKIGEALIISALKDKESLIVNKNYLNKKLSDFYLENPDFFGNYKGTYPLLTKIIDANEDLSVQVHPNDDYAWEKFKKLGKTECWYILDCPKRAELIYGSKEKNIKKIEKNIKNNDWSFLKKAPVNIGDVVYVPSGTIHAITKGILVYEIQQSSDLTFRLYDYNRKEQDGNPRELHIIDSLNSIKVDDSLKVIKSFDGLIINSSKFKLYKKTINQEEEFYFPRAKWLEVTVISGKGKIENNIIQKGSTFLVAHDHNFSIIGNLIVLIGFIE
ncbi:MAG: type I phosphomannose isomerase catalytic subunit [Metamycoplasmataceae bacterium]